MLNTILHIYQYIVMLVKRIYNWPHNLMENIFGEHTW